MIIVGLTGGIGSGKTTIAKEFESLGVPIYIADKEAKALMNRSKVIKRKLIALFGEEAYSDNKLNRPYLASKIFYNQDLLKQMNAIVHPKVASHFKRWVKKQEADYVIKEVAILFENGGNKHCHYVITVTACVDERIRRVMVRDHSSKEKVQAIINNQMPDEDKVKQSDFVIYNDDLREAKSEVKKIHKKLLQSIRNSKF